MNFWEIVVVALVAAGLYMMKRQAPIRLSLNAKSDTDVLMEKLARIEASMPKDVREAHRHSSGHRVELETSEHCGCFYCGGVFAAAEISEWIDEEETAMCPKCGIDAVIGSASGYPITDAFLQEMKHWWFNSTITA